MKTARFTDVVKKCGEPEPHLLLMDPAKDKELQPAIKAKRVMTVFQDTVGAKADRGVVGFEPGPARQFLIFPKALRAFEGKNIIGIKYELWSTKEPPKSERAAPARPPQKKAKPKGADLPSNIVVLPDLREAKRVKEAPAAARTKEKAKAVEKEKSEERARAKAKTEAKPKPERKPKREAKAKDGASPRDAAEAGAGEIAQIKEQVRAAMEALEQGKQIAAFNLLKRIVED